MLGDGNQIVVPGHTLFVSDACSGLTSIVTLLPVACILAYFVARGVWRRAVVVASVVPLTMAANVIRVVATVKLVSVIGIEAAQGVLHESFGIATYAFGTVALVGVARQHRLLVLGVLARAQVDLHRHETPPLAHHARVGERVSVELSAGAAPGGAKVHQ